MKDGKCSQCGPSNKYCMVDGGNAPEFCSTLLYKEALERMYGMPVKDTCLYFFSMGKFVYL